MVDRLFSYAEPSVAFKKYRKYHCAKLESATIMTLTCFDPVITELVDSVRSHIDMQSMCTMEIVRRPECEAEERLQPHQKWASLRGIRSLCNPRRGFESYYQSLQQII